MTESLLILLCVACPHPADVVFALDSSGSIQQDNFYVIQDFVRDVIYGINVDGGSRVGILTYATDADVGHFRIYTQILANYSRD